MLHVLFEAVEPFSEVGLFGFDKVGLDFDMAFWDFEPSKVIFE